MKDYNLWCNGVICGIAISHLIFGDYESAGICSLLAALTFVSWRTFKW